MFQLSKEDCLRCQIGTINGKRGEHLKYMPYAFTENGICHDRFIIVDGKEIFAVGASLKDAGRQTFGVVKSGSETISGLLANLRKAVTSTKVYG